MRAGKTNERILKAAQELLAEAGVAGLSFDSVARRLGVSKQAVLYWYPSKQELLGAMFLPLLEQEAGVAVAALEGAADHRDAVARFVRAVAGFHLGDLDRFRMMYLAPQTSRGKANDVNAAYLTERVHPVTDRMYGALADRLTAGTPAEARARAVSVHAATLGLAMMVALADALGDPLKHSSDSLIAALIGTLTGNGADG